MYDESKLHNRLLKSLPPEILNSICSSTEPVTLERGQVIVRANQSIDYLYFLCGGISSVIAVSTRGQLVEAGMVGREGFSPTSGAVGATTSIHEIIMQVSGYGHRIAVSAAREEINRNSVFASLLARYIQTFASQVSYTVWANVNLHVHERLARWLLMSHDRVDGDEIILTHDFIALMLGVRRPSITTGLHLLEGKNWCDQSEAASQYVTVGVSKNLLAKPTENPKKNIASFSALKTRCHRQVQIPASAARIPFPASHRHLEHSVPARDDYE